MPGDPAARILQSTDLDTRESASYPITLKLAEIEAMVNDSRRRFLTHGTGVAAGLLGVASLPQLATGNSLLPLVCDAASGSHSAYYPNDSLVRMIAKAWTDVAYKNNLLTFPEDKAPDWSNYSGKMEDLIGRTKKVFEEEGIYLEYPIVFTPDQFANYGKGSSGKRESLFVLPPPPAKVSSFKSSDEAMKTAEIAMVFCTFGM